MKVLIVIVSIIILSGIIFFYFSSREKNDKEELKSLKFPKSTSYMYILQGNADLSDKQLDFIVKNYDYLLIKGWLSKEKISDSRQRADSLNSKFKVLKYTNGMFSLTYKPEEESAYAHSESSNNQNKRIAEKQYNEGWWLMDICSQSWRDYFTSQAKSEIEKYGIDGIMVDDMGIASGLSSVKRIEYYPNYTDEEWYQCGYDFLKEVKGSLSDKTIIFNGLYHQPPYYDITYQEITDGGIREGWITRDFKEFLNEELWKKLLDQVAIDLAKYDKTFFPICISDNPSATINDRLYCFTSYLLINKPGHVSYKNPGYGENLQKIYFQPEMNVDIGEPKLNGKKLEDYYNGTSQLYEREYSNGKVIVNPTTSEKTYDLDKEYYLVTASGNGMVSKDGKINGSLTYQKINQAKVPPQSGIIILNQIP